jgi:hypothetical protein
MERQKVMAGLSFVVAGGIVIAGILGPLVLGVIRFHLPELLVNQYAGGEVVTLFLAAPALVIAGLLWLRRDLLAPVLAFGPAAYTVYTFITAVVGQEYARYDGNSEKAFPLYVALILGGVVIAACAGAEILQTDAPEPPETMRKVTAGVFLVIAAFFALAWSAQIVQVYRGEATTEYVEGPTLFWLIKLMDLGFLLPAFAAAGAGLIRRNPVAVRLSYGMVWYAVCMAGAILGMAIAMLLRDDPAASMGMVGFIAPVTAVLAFLAWRMMMTWRHGPAQRPIATTPTTPLGRGHAG